MQLDGKQANPEPAIFAQHWLVEKFRETSLVDVVVNVEHIANEIR